jgi:hypothetical protein
MITPAETVEQKSERKNYYSIHVKWKQGKSRFEEKVRDKKTFSRRK